MNDTDALAREQAVIEFMRAGRESSRLSVMFRHAAAARLGLTVTDMECLDFLMDTGAATAGQLAEQTNLTTGAITSMIRRLERAGYVTAERDPADRRRVIVTLVPERVEGGVRLYASYGNAISEVLSRHSTEEIRLLTRHYDEMSAVYRAQLATLNNDESP
ncbi:MarR family winged helix-turn-helix transcriptional regulator [Micromonospora sp. NPDC048930]|uniref:MarR family winged helix-turn-helix transcriptional regulator n=1 Tax=Micromonospora sp. NPDC048930 TaxID=3364261 RepID=UPI00371502E6